MDYTMIFQKRKACLTELGLGDIIWRSPKVCLRGGQGGIT